MQYVLLLHTPQILDSKTVAASELVSDTFSSQQRPRMPSATVSSPSPWGLREKANQKQWVAANNSEMHMVHVLLSFSKNKLFDFDAHATVRFAGAARAPRDPVTPKA